MRRFVVNCENVTSFDEFVAALNSGFIRAAGGEWNGNLDAFNDYLSWPEGEEYELEFVGAGACASALGHSAQAAWLRDHRDTCHPSNVVSMQARLAMAERGEGETLFDVIREITSTNKHVQFIES